MKGEIGIGSGDGGMGIFGKDYSASHTPASSIYNNFTQSLFLLIYLYAFIFLFVKSNKSCTYYLGLLFSE